MTLFYGENGFFNSKRTAFVAHLSARFLIQLTIPYSMVEVAPFRGILYNKDTVEKLDDVMSPPYDIISPEMQEQLYAKNKYNVVRLILGKILPGDNDKDNRYIRARKFLEEWLERKILVESENPSIYPYKIEYELDGNKKTMNGFFVLLKLDHDYRMVKAHERTLSKPKEDRLNLMRATKANLEPIELLYIDEKDEIRKLMDSCINEPEIDVVGYDGFRHRLWRIDDEKIVSRIKEKLSNEILFIADGHHRYQTAINYAKEVNAGENDPANYIMVVLANMFDEGLSILPTHRLIKKDINLDNIIEKAREYFDIETYNLSADNIKEKAKDILDSIKTDSEHKFFIYHKKGCYILTLKDTSIMDRLAPDRSKVWRNLDVSILHKTFLEKIMGINETNLEDHVKYTRDTIEALNVVDEEKFVMSIIMNPTKIEEIKAVAEAGEHMPQKSTYFLPKLLSGLVMRRI